MTKNINYTLRQNIRAKRIKITVCYDGSVVITKPNYINQTIIDRFLADKSNWIINKINYFKTFTQKPIYKYPKNDYKIKKEQSRKLVLNRISRFNKIYQFVYNKVSIKNQQTRWGSCSSKKNLNFNYKIIYLPEKQQDYLIVHELCHLKEMNHSRRFWEQVARTIPNYKILKNSLKNQKLFYQ